MSMSMLSAKDLTVDLLIRYGFQLLGAVVILVAGAILARWVGSWMSKWLESRTMEPPVRMLIVRVVRVIVLIFTLVVALDKFGFQIAPLVAGIGVAGLGVGFVLHWPLRQQTGPARRGVSSRRGLGGGCRGLLPWPTCACMGTARRPARFSNRWSIIWAITGSAKSSTATRPSRRGAAIFQAWSVAETPRAWSRIAGVPDERRAAPERAPR